MFTAIFHFVLAIFEIFIAAIVIKTVFRMMVSQNNKHDKKCEEEIKKRPGFENATILKGWISYLAISLETFQIIIYKPFEKTNKQTIINFEDISKFEKYIDDTVSSISRTETSLGRIMVGQMIAGDFGAINAALNSQKTKTESLYLIRKLSIKFFTTDFENPIKEFVIFSSKKYENYADPEKLDEWCAKIWAALNYAAENRNIATIQQEREQIIRKLTLPEQTTSSN